jgi:hypothetical protein
MNAELSLVAKSTPKLVVTPISQHSRGTVQYTVLHKYLRLGSAAYHIVQLTLHKNHPTDLRVVIAIDSLDHNCILATRVAKKVRAVVFFFRSSSAPLH